MYSNKTIITFRRVIFLEVLNLFLFQRYFKIQYISTALMFVGFVFLLYIHFNNQEFYSKKVNCFYSALWVSMALSSLVSIFLTVIKVELLYPIFLGVNVLGLIVGWVINNLYSKWYINRLISAIEKKYNQQHIITKLREQLEMENVNEDERKSLETIVTQKKIIKKDKIFKKLSDCAYLSQFIIISQFERSQEIYIQFWYFLHGIRVFISINRLGFPSEDVEDAIRKINHISEKVLYKCANLSKSLFEKYLVYLATYVYENDKSYLKSSENSSDQESTDFELIEMRNRSVQYHLAALNHLKQLMEALKTLDNPSDIDNALVVNDQLTEILNDGEFIYKKYVALCDYSRESLELYILFLRNSM
eukprot:jgi/Orpsp1_1/1185312/evm.model.c7180000093211.1